MVKYYQLRPNMDIKYVDVSVSRIKHCMRITFADRVVLSFTLRASCGAVHCNRPCLCVCLFVGLLPR